MHFVNPAADIPIVAVSVAKQNASGVNANLHYRIGRALEPLRDQNIAIIGSGMSMHNTNNGKTPVSNIAEFISAIESACSIPDPDARGDALSKWTSFPYALSAFKPSKAVRTNTADSHLMPVTIDTKCA